MSGLEGRFLSDLPRKERSNRFHAAYWIVIPLLAILFQVYVPRFLPYLSYLELPLLVTVYFSLMRREPVSGAIIGTLIGLVQDSLSSQPLGMFGIVKTLVGYFAGSISQRFDVDNQRVCASCSALSSSSSINSSSGCSRAHCSARRSSFNLPQTIIYGVR